MDPSRKAAQSKVGGVVLKEFMQGISEDESMQAFKVGITGVKLMREATDERDGKIVYLPPGLSYYHMPLIKAALESDYTMGDDQEEENTAGFTLWKSNLTDWKIKYFDTAANWLAYKGDVLLKDGTKDRHFDKVASLVKYMDFARDLGLDDMCIAIYRLLKEEIWEVREVFHNSWQKPACGFWTRKILRQVRCVVWDDYGSTMNAVIGAELQELDSTLEKVDQELEEFERPANRHEWQLERLNEQKKWLETFREKLRGEVL